MFHIQADHFAGSDLRTSPAHRFAVYLSQIVGAASVGPSGVRLETGIPCRRRPAHKPCPGLVDAVRVDVPATVEWLCPACADSGVVTHWKHGDWNLAEEMPDPVETTTVLVPGPIYRSLLSCLFVEVTTLQAVLSGRRTAAGMVRMRVSEDQLDSLTGELSLQMLQSRSAGRRRQLAEALRLMERAVSLG
ncbi:MAG: hypothetical protein ACYCYK_00955 [Candidatus Dormibacteria bacterium]